MNQYEPTEEESFRKGVQHIEILEELEENKEDKLSQKEIADRLGKEDSTISKILKRLESAGIVKMWMKVGKMKIWALSSKGKVILRSYRNFEGSSKIREVIEKLRKKYFGTPTVEEVLRELGESEENKDRRDKVLRIMNRMGLEKPTEEYLGKRKRVTGWILERCALEKAEKTDCEELEDWFEYHKGNLLMELVDEVWNDKEVGELVKKYIKNFEENIPKLKEPGIGSDPNKRVPTGNLSGIPRWKQREKSLEEHGVRPPDKKNVINLLVNPQEIETHYDKKYILNLLNWIDVRKKRTLVGKTKRDKGWEISRKEVKRWLRAEGIFDLYGIKDS